MHLLHVILYKNNELHLFIRSRDECFFRQYKYCSDSYSHTHRYIYNFIHVYNSHRAKRDRRRTVTVF